MKKSLCWGSFLVAFVLFILPFVIVYAQEASQPPVQPGPGAMFTPGDNAPRPQPVNGQYLPPQNTQPQPTQFQQMPAQNGQYLPPPNQQQQPNQMEPKTQIPPPDGQNFQKQMPPPNNSQGGQNFNAGQGMGNGQGGGQSQNVSSEFRAEVMKKWATQLEKQANQFEKRIANYGKKNVPISADTKTALTSLQSTIEKAKNLPKDEQLDMGEVNDFIQTLNEGLRDADVAAQFPKVMKDVANEIKRQNTAIKNADKKVAKIKFDISALMAEWKKDLADMTALKEAAQTTYDKGDVTGAVDSLRNDFFDISRDANEKAQTFNMVSNFGQMIKTTEKDLKNFTSLTAKLKKKSKDVTELESLLTQGTAKIAELKIAITSTDVDVMLELAEEVNGLKMDFEDAYYALSGQSAYGTMGQKPILQSLQGSGPQQNQQYFNPVGGSIMPQNGGQTCNIGGVEMPGSCQDLEKQLNAQNQGGAIYWAVRSIKNWFTD